MKIKLSNSLRKVFGTVGQPNAEEKRLPIFIIGCMRSGTTFLVDKLTSHPQLLKIGSELNEVWTDIGGANCQETCEYKSAKDSNARFTYQMSNYFFEFIQQSKSIKRHLMRLSILLNHKKGRVFYDWKNIIPVNKSPHLMNKIGYVNALFPGSKMVLIIRDIYSHSSSMKAHFDVEFKRTNLVKVFPKDDKLCWGNVSKSEIKGIESSLTYPGNFSLIPEMWIRLNYLALKEIETLEANQRLIVCYEDLVTNQKEQIHATFKFIDLESKYKKEEEEIALSTMKFKNTSTKGDPLIKWKKHLTAIEIKDVETAIENNKSKYQFIINKLNELKI